MGIRSNNNRRRLGAKSCKWLRSRVNGSGGSSSPQLYEQENDDAGQKLSILFDESSGNITEDINGLTFTASGSPTYSVSPGTGLYAGLGTGIAFAANTRFTNTSASACSPGTNDFVIEFWYKTSSSNNQAVFRILDASDNNSMWLEIRPGVPGIQLYITEVGMGNTNIIWSETGGINLDDGAVHKVEIVMDRDGSAECFVDNVSQGTASISDRSAWTVPTNKIYIGAFEDNSEDFLGTLFGLRFVTGLTANLFGIGD